MPNTRIRDPSILTTVKHPCHRFEQSPSELD